MADKKISALTASTTPLAGTEVLPIVQGGATVKVSVANLTAGRDTSVAKLLASDNITIESAGTSFTGITINRTGGTAANWFTYIPPSSSDLRWFKGADLAILDASGNYTVTGSTKTDGLVSHAGVGGAYNSNKFNFQWTGSPALWIDTVLLGNINYTSDYRIKRNIASQTESGLEKILRLRPVVYQMADYANLFKASDEIKEGFIAHEVQEVIPSGAEGVKDAEDQIQSLRLDAILSVAVKAIQEQQEQIEALKAEVAALKGA